MAATPHRPPSPVQTAGYPTGLEGCVFILVAGQIAMTWLALDRLPSTVVPYGPTGAALGLPGAALEAQMWTWMVLGLWSLGLGLGLVSYRVSGASPVPVLTSALFAALAVLRAGVIGLNLNPDLGQTAVFVRAVVAGGAVLLLAAGVEQWRTRKRLRHALTRKPRYDEPSPRGPFYWEMAACLVPYVLLPTRLRVIDEGLVAITPLTYLYVPLAAVAEARAVGPLPALLGGGVNLATSPGSAVRIKVRGRLLPLTLSVVDRPRFLAALGLGDGVA